MSRPVKVTRPGSGGIVTDVPPHDIPHEATVTCQDMVYPFGVARQRRGWVFDGGTQSPTPDVTTVVGSPMRCTGIYRARFPRASGAPVRTLTCYVGTNTVGNPGGVYVHWPDRAGTIVGSPINPDGYFVPRAMYNGELLFAGSNGRTGVGRYAGSLIPATNPLVPGAGQTWTIAEGTITGGTGYPSLPDRGSYVPLMVGQLLTGDVYVPHLVSAVTSLTSITIQDVKAGATTALSLTAVAQGFANGMWPCVEVYNAGTASANAGILTGFGTKWLNDALPMTFSESQYTHVLLNDAGTYRLEYLANIATDTSASMLMTSAVAKTDYALITSPRSIDVAAHKESVWFAGGEPYPNRIYLSPPGWNISTPPGATLPFNPTALPTSTNRGYFLLDYIDIPAPLSAPLVAILPSQNALWAFTRDTIFGVYGSWPDVSQAPIAQGIGCMDKRAAIAVAEGLFWASEQGVFWSPDGRQMVNLTRGRVEKEWRAMANEGFDFVTLGVTYGYLAVALKTCAGSTRTWVVHLDPVKPVWECRLSNTNPSAMFSARVTGEVEALWCVQDTLDPHVARPFNLRPALDLTGPTYDGDGTGVAGKLRTGPLTGPIEDTDGAARLLDLSVHHNLWDPTSSGTTVSIRVITDGSPSRGAAARATGLPKEEGIFRWGYSKWNDGSTWGPGAGKAVGSLVSHRADGEQRIKFPVGRMGRQHAVEWKFVFSQGPTSTDMNSTVELDELVLSFSDGRFRT